MPMDANPPVHIIDEDEDEFDWEAAVREIDVACEATNAPSSPHFNGRPVQLPTKTPFVNTSAKTNFPSFTNTKKPCNSRQSTLDKFIGNAGSRSFSEERSSPDPDEGLTELNGGICCVGIDPEAAKTWIYPVNVPRRDYQFAITKKALFSNTLVALPTGLGKTFIAAVVMYNYFRWFPDGKVVFSAPSRPLVMQQIEACHNIVGIPQEWTIDMTGQTNPTKRARFWESKRVFFVTPQVLEKDIQSGTCLVKHLVCLVIDEAHRAMGNYSYCVAVRELMAIPLQLRILALTATPGSKQQTIQTVIDNLQISTLEYRNESDPDVSPYVHNRKLELILVAMGKDAVEINDLLLQIIGPYAAKLSAIGVLPHRDYRSLSPCELVTARDKLCGAPPPDLTKSKYDEANRCFTALITLYHIRKLLSSHGVRPAYEMLEEKLKEGRFARLMGNDAIIRKVKLLMQQNLSYGAPSPKLLKMLEVLAHHFKTNDPRKSRVIVFSNFRGSVRDIMNALMKMGDLVRATEFIGQSSGKALKGQSQKVQQAVLEKFRAGKYNVIVATSIGEEGLDIMEVDLVICFDANVSPLRMIQRMGRTGRKHDGRVVILACEGSELKGYMRKQANSKAVRKHMRNGGINSFSFHPSPRMIPHIYKPEVQFVEFAIEQFVPRGKKVKNDHAVQTPLFKEKLTDSENVMLMKYFSQTRNVWKPSLIAFPQFQAFPSTVHKVMHSSKTKMLIDLMQNFQELSFSINHGNAFIEDEAASSGHLRDEATDKNNEIERAAPADENFMDAQLPTKLLDSEPSPLGTSKTSKQHNIPDMNCNSTTHSCLFSSDFVCIDAAGNVMILSIPTLPFRGVSDGNALLPNPSRLGTCDRWASSSIYEEANVQAKTSLDLLTSQSKYTKNNNMLGTSPASTGAQQEIMLHEVEKGFQSPKPLEKCFSETNGASQTPSAVDQKALIFLDEECGNGYEDARLSPRLTNLIRSGVVPESPIHNCGSVDSLEKNEDSAPENNFPEKLGDESLLEPTSFEGNKRVLLDNNAHDRVLSASPVTSETQAPVTKMRNGAIARRHTFTSPISEEVRTPLENLKNRSYSGDWNLHAGDKSGSVCQPRKFRRLKKVGGIGNTRKLEVLNERVDVSAENLSKSFCDASPVRHKGSKGRTKSNGDIRAFIEEEAEVSLEAEMSDDEENDQDNESYDDSFIDDRINPTEASTQAEDSGVDMMAIYRRSLLTQSPMMGHINSLASMTPDNEAFLSKEGSSSSSRSHAVQTPRMNSAEKNSGYFRTLPEIPLESIHHSDSVSSKDNLSNVGIRKRKLSFYRSGCVPVVNLEKEFSLCPEATGNEPFERNQEENAQAKEDVFCDDQFYEGLDLDAVEAQATFLLRQKHEMSTQKQGIPQQDLQSCHIINSPNFDLGI